jgi:autotransporter-associated beta strand protein
VLLSNANTYSGNTSVNSGTLTIDTTGSIASGNVTVASGATLNVNGALVSTANVTANGATNFAGNHTANPTLPIPLGLLNVGPSTTVKVAASDGAFRPAVLSPSSLNIDPSGKIDLTNNELVMTSTTADQALTLIQSGQINSSLLPDANHALGYINMSGANAGSAEVRYTLKGDANLDGTVDVGDLGALATSYGITGGMSWANGDFNQDHNVDVGDLGTLATNYGTSLGNGPAAGQVAQSLAVAAGGGAAVPEPGTLGMIGLVASGLLVRRARRGAK